MNNSRMGRAFFPVRFALGPAISADFDAVEKVVWVMFNTLGAIFRRMRIGCNGLSFA
jgi:hypothetical protein